MPIQQILRPYQVEVGRAVLRSVLERRGLTFTVEVARQGGKNELSAQLEVLLLTLFMAHGGNLVKAAPTYVPQLLHSILRLKDRLKDAGYTGLWSPEPGNIIRVGKARQLFLSAEPSARVVGATAHILLEMDEAQEVEKGKFYKEFRPMGASTNATTVLYGTPWDGNSLLEEQKQQNLELERKDGLKRHFQFDWQEVARHNPLYHAYVDGERQRLGEDHPLFRSQYLLLPVHGGNGLLDGGQRAQLQGSHHRQHAPTQGKTYVAAIDLAGGASSDGSPQSEDRNPHRDSTVVTMGELDFDAADPFTGEPQVRIVEHAWWTGVAPASLYPQLVDLLQRVWRCRRLVVDATGLGQGTASFLERGLGSGVVEPFIFTAQSKSRLGFDLLAAINGGRLKMYAAEGSKEHQEFWKQIEQAQSYYRPNRTMNFLVNPSRGHDDFLASLALLVKAAQYTPRVARGRPGISGPALEPAQIGR
ncbi:MAG: hypothetical protein Q7K03_09160 [Dehalococcoidia bacterium]|nr:hypothetical protein [Dehalococcoidia bacterium]